MNNSTVRTYQKALKMLIHTMWNEEKGTERQQS